MKSTRVTERRGMIDAIMVIGQRIGLKSNTMIKRIETREERRADLAEIALKRASQNQDSAITWALHSYKMQLRMMVIV